MTGETARSPWEQVWKQFVPQGHDQALRNAFYNVAAAVFVAVAAAAAWSVYLIFQPFLQSLLWAVLCGSVLHPVKHHVTLWVRNWLHNLQSSGSLLSISTAVLPFSFIDNLSEIIGWFIVAHMKGVVAVTVVLPLIYIVIHHTPTAFSSLAYTLLTTILYIIQFVVTTVTTYHSAVLALVVIYCVAVLFFWTPETKDILHRFTIPFWILFAAAIAGLWPSASVVIFLVLCSLLMAGLAMEVLDVYAQSKEIDGANVSLISSIVKVCLGNVDSSPKPAITPDDADTKQEYTSSLESVQEEDEIDRKVDQELKETEHGTLDNDQDAVSCKTSDDNKQMNLDDTDAVTTSTPKPDAQNKDRVEEVNLDTPKIKTQNTDAYQTPTLTTPRPRTLGTAGFSSPLINTPRTALSLSKYDDEGGGSIIYIKGVFVACVLVELWQHNYLLPLLPLAMFYYFVKKMTSSYLSSGAAYDTAKGGLDQVYSCALQWAETRKSVFLPLPMRGLLKLLIRTDGRIVDVLLASVDVVVTLLLMLGVIMFMTTTSLFLAVQVQGESMHMVTMGSQVINSTVVNNPQFHQMLPEGLDEVMQSTLDNAYLYGREWIAGMVREMLGETDEAKAAALVKQVEELWDRVYQAWVAAHPQAPARGPVVTSEAVALTVDSLIDGIRKTPGLVSMSFLTEVVRENLGTVVSVLESVWHILLSNLSLCVSTLTAASSLLLGGSLSILNALINVVVFMSALFYILSTSGAVYKPVAMLSSLAPGPMNKLGLAVEQAVNGVFTASFKMGAFYGMWTWLLHSLFATNIVYIPSVLGALFGAVPLVGTYWAALPGVLELWWGHGSPSLAALLLIAQVLPLSCVDTAIYGDIKGGVHPYLTGLAVAGGVFCWGVEGAILGPLVLCILLVATNMYASLIQGPSDLSRRFQKLRRVSAVN